MLRIELGKAHRIRTASFCNHVSSGSRATSLSSRIISLVLGEFQNVNGAASPLRRRDSDAPGEQSEVLELSLKTQLPTARDYYVWNRVLSLNSFDADGSRATIHAAFTQP